MSATIFCLDKFRLTPKAAPMQAEKSFSSTTSLAPHLLEPGRERNGVIYAALVIAGNLACPVSHMTHHPLAVLEKTLRALALLEIECAELDAAQKGGKS